MFREGSVVEAVCELQRATGGVLKADTKVDTTIVEYDTSIVEYKVFGAGKGSLIPQHSSRSSSKVQE